MRISDEERREVAENLRNLTIGHFIQYKEQFFDELAEVVVGFEDYHDFNVSSKSSPTSSTRKGEAMITDKQRREAVEFLRSGTCLYFAEHRKLELDCNRCMKVSTMLFGHYDALCGLDSCGTDAWQRLADLIDRPSENIGRRR